MSRDQESASVLMPFINGASRTSRTEATAPIINPSNGQSWALITAGCDEDANEAVSAARRALVDGRWSDRPPSWRKAVLHRLADLIGARAAALDALDACEMGKPIREAFCSAAAAAGLMRFYAEAIDKVTGDVFSSDKHSFVSQRRAPRGVVAAIVPWNFPTFNAVLKIAPALAAGNCVVLKPSEFSSSSALQLAQLAIEAGVPDGVLNVVPGLGETVGRALGLHMDVDLVTFTGSTAVGKRMMQYSGQSNMKVVMAECGGKSPQIVFADGVDIVQAADAIAKSLITNQGQVCSVGSRLLVQKSIEEEVVDNVLARLRDVRIGNALDQNTTFGPLVSAQQAERVMTYINDAQNEGATLVTGGQRALVDTGGNFVHPTVFRDVSSDSRLAQEEIFGPVLSVISFQDEEEAIRIANNTVYGLVAYVWTASLSTGMRMARGIRSSVLINSAASTGEGAGHAMSSEPMRQSGLGTEGGLAGMESYMRRQLVWFSHG